MRKSELYTDIDRYFRKKISIVIEHRLRKERERGRERERERERERQNERERGRERERKIERAWNGNNKGHTGI